MSTANASQCASELCAEYAGFLFVAGKITMFVGIALGVSLAVAAVVVAFRKQPAAADGAEVGFAAPTAVLDSIKGFIQAIASAPTWLALFAGGVLLLWMAGSVRPEWCKPAIYPGAQAPAKPGAGGSEVTTTTTTTTSTKTTPSAPPQQPK